MLGTIANALAIMVGSIVGLFFGGKIQERYNETVIKAMGLSVILLGVMGALETKEILLVILSLAIGSILGEYLQIEENLERFGKWVENRLEGLGQRMGKKVENQQGGIAKGFVTASLLFCVGSLAITGALQGGLVGNHDILYAKAIIDGIISIAFASTMGIGVALSAIAVFVYQGAIAMTASFMKVFLVDEIIREMSAIGGLLVMGIGFNMLDFKRIKVGNMLPAMFIPLIYFMGKTLFFYLMHM